jgi:hypothetical protein
MRQEYYVYTIIIPCVFVSTHSRHFFYSLGYSATRSFIIIVAAFYDSKFIKGI